MADSTLEVGQVCAWCSCDAVRTAQPRPAAAPRPNKAPAVSQQKAPDLSHQPYFFALLRHKHVARLTRLAGLCTWQRVVVMGKRKGVVRFFGPTAYGPGARLASISCRHRPCPCSPTACVLRTRRGRHDSARLVSAQFPPAVHATMTSQSCGAQATGLG